jgi:hypothetical protein
MNKFLLHHYVHQFCARKKQKKLSKTIIMKSFRLFSLLAVAVSFSFFFSSCKKDKGSVSKNITKDQLVGKWNMTIQSNGSISVQATLKASGAMELDQAPYDGIPELILLWDVNNNNFTAHLDANGITNYWKMDAPIDTKTLSMAGSLKVNDPNSPQSGLFTMDKQ